MAKSASTLLCHYTIRLLQRAFPRNGVATLEQATGDGSIRGISCFVESLNTETLPLIEGIAREQGPVLVKIHAPVHAFLQESLDSGRIRMVTTFRDPRDVILSAMDHARRTRGTPQAVFQEFTSVEDSIPHVRWWAEMALGWKASGMSYMVRYENIYDDPAAVLGQVAAHYGIPADEPAIEAVVAEERATRAYAANQFNKGLRRRFPAEMSPEQVALCNECLGDCIQALGYPLELS